jgi:transposase-like protein
MGKVSFSDDFKRDAVHQITERGYPVAEASRREPAFALRLEEEVFEGFRFC